MKRKDRRKILLEHSKTLSEQPQADPKSANVKNEKRSVTGNVHVRGEILVEPTPKEALARSAAEAQKSTHERKKWRLERASFVVLSLYAALTFWQGWLTRSLVKTARETYEATARPYIGISNVAFVFLVCTQGNCQITSTPPSTENIFDVHFTMDIKNYGPVPGAKFVSAYKVFINGVEQPRKIIPTSPVTMWPNEVQQMEGHFSGEDYRGFFGSTVGTANIFIEYWGPNGEYYHDCTKGRFTPPNAFTPTGPCSPEEEKDFAHVYD